MQSQVDGKEDGDKGRQMQIKKKKRWVGGTKR